MAPGAGRQWAADGTARQRFLQETALSLVFDLGVARPLKEGADPAEAVGQLCVRPAQTPKPQARFSP
ncbi:hypothetical protein CapIbe_006483 [Capra ibex]